MRLRDRFVHSFLRAAGRRLLPAVCAGVALALVTWPANAQLRVVNYNIAQLRGNPTAVQAVFAALNADDKPGFAVPPHVYVMQEVRTTELMPIRDLLNAAGASFGVTYTVGTYTTSGEDNTGGAQAVFYRANVVTEITSGHTDIASGAFRFTDRWLFQLNGYASPLARFYIYSSHLRADEGTAQQNERAMGAAAVRANADALGPGIHIILAGDWNLYNNNEQAYQNFTAPGNAQVFDPFGTGSWAGAANAVKHTQSPRTISASGLASGGMDDRFDFQLATAAFNDAAGLSLIPGTYRALGNDGNHYNVAINLGNNTYYPTNIARSNALANALHDASDHIPVVADYRVPGVMSATLAPSVGRMIQGTIMTTPVTVTNVANSVHPDGADVIEYTVTSSGSLSGTGSGSVALFPAQGVVHLIVNTSNVGQINGSAVISTMSQAAQNPLIIRNTTGSVLTPSNASFSNKIDLDFVAVPWSVQADTGVQTIDVPVHNFGYTSNQALLDIDAVSPLSPPFGFVSGLATNIGSTPAALRFSFDTASVQPGPYSTNVLITVSDENIPGATSAAVAVQLQVTVGGSNPLGDLNGDGSVGPADLGILLGSWGNPGCGGALPCAADLNNDGAVGPADLGILLGNWG